MRFLFCTRPYLGHLYPMVPLARELVRRGNQVVVASSPDLEAEVIAAGLEFSSAGLHPATQLPRQPGESGRVGGYDSGILRSKLADLLAIERADVIVREPTDLAAAIAAEANETPLVVLGRSHHITAATWKQVLGGDLDSVRTGVGLPPDPHLACVAGGLYLDAVPPWFYVQPPSGPRYAAVDTGSYDGASDKPLRCYPRMPYAYVTLGTYYHGDAEFFRVAVAALRACGIGVVVSAGSDLSATALAPLAGDDCVIRAFVPQTQVLCGATVVICHGGFSTAVGAIKAGLPVICVPRGSDQHANARHCESLGVGIRVSPADWNVARAGDAIARVLKDGVIAARARALAARDDRLPTTEDVADLLQVLPKLRAEGADPVQKLKATAASRPRSYRIVNRAGWGLLSRAGCRSSRPLSARAPKEARRFLDPDGWLPWSQLRSVLCLAAGGGQQGPLFASLGYEVLVADLSEEQLRRDREAASSQQLAIETLQADMCDLAALGDRQFDLVYQPISTCYIPDLRRLYLEVAKHVRPGGWYWSQHYSPAHMQIDATNPWDGTAYRIVHRLAEGQRLPWMTEVGGQSITIDHYLHGLGALAGGICQAGFVLQQIKESGPVSDGSMPGEPAHMSTYFLAFLTILGRRTST